MKNTSFFSRAAAGIFFGLSLLLACGCGSNAPHRVVLYCAQDREFAEQILPEFTKRTGIRVDAKYDTEADKSVSLYTELINEKDRPRCDLYWNNEILSTIRLARQGLLEPYDTLAAVPYPDSAKAKDRTWYAFANRARLLIVNTQQVKEADRPQSLFDLAEPRWKGRVAMAKPQFGTSATQAACLFEVLGPEKAKRFYQDLKKNDIHIVPGNKQVAEGVGHGEFAFGVTDTDDAMDEVRAGRPVAIIFPDRDQPKSDRMGTLYIPNTLAIIRGGPNPDGAKKLLSYLLSPEVETKLAEGESHQIPMNPEVRATLPKEILRPNQVKVMDVDFEKAAALWDETQTFLRNEFSR